MRRRSLTSCPLSALRGKWALICSGPRVSWIVDYGMWSAKSYENGILRGEDVHGFLLFKAFALRTSAIAVSSHCPTSSVALLGLTSSHSTKRQDPYLRTDQPKDDKQCTESKSEALVRSIPGRQSLTRHRALHVRRHARRTWTRWFLILAGYVLCTMAHTPMLVLARYLLHGQLCHRGCLRVSPRGQLHKWQVPFLLPSSLTEGYSRRALIVPTQHQNPEHREPPTTASKPNLTSHTPLRKQLKTRAKTQKKSKAAVSARQQTVSGWELTVGIEIHAQLNTRRKLFSPARPPAPSDDPNTHTALFDLATPGSQPLFQSDALVPAIRAAIALNCQVQPISRWDRKHYFWWDQPSGYQITQFYEPFARDGHILLYERDGIAPEDGESVTIGIRQIQMEQDTAKTVVRPDGVQWVDFNRVGVPLIEIITEAEMHHPKTAAALVRKVQMYLNSVDACISGMEAGGLRADVNVSVRRTDSPQWEKLPLGQRTEIKNLSSFKAVEEAIIAERDRQIAVLKEGGLVLGETRGWSVGGTETIRLRGKEGEVDYRYMPDPDLAPLLIGDNLISNLRDNLGMLPDSEVEELITQYGLKTKDALALMQLDDGGRIEYFYDVIARLQGRLREKWNKECGVLAANWVLNELGRLTSERNAAEDGSVKDLGMEPTGECSRVPSAHLADIVYFLHMDKISAGVAKELLFSVFRGDFTRTSGEAYKEIEEAIEKEDLWFKQLSEDEYKQLAGQVLDEEVATLEKKFGPYYLGKKEYPNGQLQRLVGRMIREGPSERIDPNFAAGVMREAIDTRMTGQ